MSRLLNAPGRFIFLDLIGSVFWFPVWWYGAGVARLVRTALLSISSRARAYGFAIWIKNFFVPMYGQTDLAGRLVSVFMRFVVLVGRGVAFVFESLLWGVGLLLWLITPIASAGLFLVNLFARAASA